LPLTKLYKSPYRSVHNYVYTSRKDVHTHEMLVF